MYSPFYNLSFLMVFSNVWEKVFLGQFAPRYAAIPSAATAAPLTTVPGGLVSTNIG